MHKIKQYITITALLLLILNPVIKAQKNLDEYKGKWIFKASESKVTFKIGNLFIFNVKGEMPVKSGYFKNNDKPEIKVIIGVSYINTGNNKRDNHLKSEDFFYTEKYPEIKFTSNNVTVNNIDKHYTFQTKGKLKIRGIEKEEVVLFNIEKVSESEILITGEAKINRLDYEVDYEMSGMDDEAKVTFEVKAQLEK